MKTLFCTIGILALSLSALADDKYGYQKRDWIDKDKINIHDRYGKVIGYQKRDWIDKDKINTYDRYGKKTGYLKRDWIDKDKFNLFRRCP